MKKNLLSTICALGALASHPAAAQYYVLPNVQAGQNPRSLNTDYEEDHDIATAPWNLIMTGSNTTQVAPEWSLVQTLPFSFQMNGQTFNSYKVSSSGVLTFSTGATAVPGTVNRVLPDAAIPDNSVCMWGTLLTANNDYVVTKTFGTAPNRQHWVQFNSISIPGGNTNVPYANGYMFLSIVLEEGSNKVYTVWQRSTSQPESLTVGVQLSSTQAVQVAASPAVSVPNLSDPTAADNGYYEFGMGAPTARDLALRSLNLPTIVSRATTVPIAGNLYNLGSQAVTSYAVNYKVNNGPTVSGTVSGVNIASATQTAFAHPTPWVPTVTGRYNLKVWLSNPNGQADQNPTNDTLRASLRVQEDSLRRYVVEECFTSSTCPPCVAGNAIIERVNRTNAGKQVVIKYQQNFPSPGNDPYYTTECGARRSYYGISAIPYMTLDGGWNQNSQLLTAGVLDQFQAVPVTMRIKGNYTLTQGRNVAATATIRPFQAYGAGQLVAHMVITERHTVLNARTNGETEFYQVMKKMLPNQNGTALPALAAGQAYTLSQAFDMSTLPASQAVEHFDSLRVVVFVQDVATKTIYQGAYMTLRSATATRTPQAGTAFQLAPNPASGRTALFFSLERSEKVRVEVLDVVGRKVLALAPQQLSAGSQELTLDLGQRPAGLYTVRLTTSQGIRTQKLTLE